MSRTTDKRKGSPNRVAGKVKQGVGKMADEADPKGEGKGSGRHACRNAGGVQKCTGP